MDELNDLVLVKREGRNLFFANPDDGETSKRLVVRCFSREEVEDYQRILREIINEEGHNMQP